MSLVPTIKKPAPVPRKQQRTLEKYMAENFRDKEATNNLSREVNHLQNIRIPNSAAIEEVIRVNTTAGSGSKDDPVREIVTYWTMRGDLIAIRDPVGDVSTCEEKCSAPHG